MPGRVLAATVQAPVRPSAAMGDQMMVLMPSVFQVMPLWRPPPARTILPPNSPADIEKYG